MIKTILFTNTIVMVLFAISNEVAFIRNGSYIIDYKKNIFIFILFLFLPIIISIRNFHRKNSLFINEPIGFILFTIFFLGGLLNIKNFNSFSGYLPLHISALYLIEKINFYFFYYFGSKSKSKKGN